MGPAGGGGGGQLLKVKDAFPTFPQEYKCNKREKEREIMCCQLLKMPCSLTHIHRCTTTTTNVKRERENGLPLVKAAFFMLPQEYKCNKRENVMPVVKVFFTFPQ